FRHPTRELPRFLVIAAERAVGRQPRRAEEDDGLVDPLAAKATQRFQVLGEDAQRARVLTFEELVVVVREGATGGFRGFHDGSVAQILATACCPACRVTFPPAPQAPAPPAPPPGRPG